MYNTQILLFIIKIIRVQLTLPHSEVHTHTRIYRVGQKRTILKYVTSVHDDIGGHFI